MEYKEIEGKNIFIKFVGSVIQKTLLNVLEKNTMVNQWTCGNSLGGKDCGEDLLKNTVPVLLFRSFSKRDGVHLHSTHPDYNGLLTPRRIHSRGRKPTVQLFPYAHNGRP